MLTKFLYIYIYIYVHVFFLLFYDSKNQKLYFFYWHRTISANITIWMCFIDTVTSLLFTIKIWEITCSCSHSKQVFLCRIKSPLFSCVSHVVLWASPRCKMENLTCSGLVVGNQCRHLFTSEKKKKREKNPIKPAGELQHGKSSYLDVLIHTETSGSSWLFDVKET